MFNSRSDSLMARVERRRRRAAFALSDNLLFI
jgi:hypothetical protein